MKRPVSVLTRVLPAETKRCRKESDVQFVGRWHQLNLTVVADSHFHITGKDSTGCDIWAPERDRFDVYLQQGRQLVSDPSEIFREGVYFTRYWWDGVGVLSKEQMDCLVITLDDVAEMQGAKAQQGSSGMGCQVWQPRYQANQSEASSSCIRDAKML